MTSATKETPPKENEDNENSEVPGSKESATRDPSTQEHPVDKGKETATETLTAER